MKIKISKSHLNNLVKQIIRQGLIKSKSQMQPPERLKSKKEFFKSEDKNPKQIKKDQTQLKSK